VSDHAAIVREVLTGVDGHALIGCQAALAALDALVAERDEWEVAAKKISGARNRWKKRAEAAEAAARRVPALDAEIDRLGAYCRTQDAEVARLREALGVIADYYEAVYAPGDQAYQAAIVARAALGDDA